ncbi:MAG: helix-turn-helix domain-containing protein [Bacteroidia bacterium]|nr:helix-turn-helix domain-containing protein [Bacteroidia bacterium]
MDSSIYISLNVVAIVNIAILLAFLVARKNNVLPNRVLAIILAIPGLYLVDNVLICTQVVHDVALVFFFVQIIANLFPPAVYYYVHLLLGDRKRYHPYLLAGTCVTVLLSCYVLGHFLLLEEGGRTQFLDQLSRGNYPLVMSVYNLVFYAWQMVYFIVLSVEIKRYYQQVKNSLASLDGVKYYFVRQFVSVLLVLNLLLLVLYLTLPMPMVDYGLLPIVVTIIYVFIVVFLLRNNAIFNRATYAELEQQNEDVHANYNQQVDAEPIESRFDAIVEKLEFALMEEQLYLNPKLKLSDLAKQIDEPEYLTSKCLNTHYSLTFYDLVNKLRVETAKTLLKDFDSKVDKIENIGYASGFNSRASFYRSFKKIVGKSPSDFVSSD